MKNIKQNLINLFRGFISKTSKGFNASISHSNLARALLIMFICLSLVTAVSAGNVTMQLGNLTADYFIGDGSLLTNIPGTVLDRGVSTQELVGYWPFDGNSDDYSGGGNDGTISGGVTNTSSGRFGDAYEFDGKVGSNLNLTHNPTKPFPLSYNQTIMMWVYAEDDDTADELWRHSGAGYFIMRYIDSGYYDNKFGSYCFDSGVTVFTDNTYARNQWHHIALTSVTYGATGINCSIYVDGIFDNDGVDTTRGNLPSTAGRTLVFGEYATNHFNGTMDEIMLWNRTLSAEEIDTLYRMTGPVAVKEAYYKKSDTLPSSGGNTSAEIATVVRNYPTGNTTAELTAFLNTNRTNDVRFGDDVFITGGINVSGRVILGEGDYGGGVKPRLFVNSSDGMDVAGYFISNDEEAIRAISTKATYRAIYARNADANSWGVYSYGGSCDFKAGNAGSTDYCSSSSIKYKENVQDMTGSLNKINALRPVTYDVKAQYGGGKSIGLVAEEVEPIVPEVIARGIDEDNEVAPAIDYSKLVPVLIDSIQELQAELCKKDNTYEFC